MPLHNCTVLFIEDDSTTQEHIKQILEDDVKEFYQAYDGEMGLDLYHDKQPDIVITDINLPLLNGLHLAKKIKEYKQTQELIIMSTHSDRDNLLHSINLGSSGFITKPIDVDLLFEKLNSIAKQIQKGREEKKKDEDKIKELYHLAHYDTLTQLPNRLLFDKELLEYIDTSTAEEQNFFLCFLDLDHFKGINDTYGHDAGDHVLTVITRKLSQSVLSRDIISRRSGDEFLILLKSHTDKRQVKQLMDNILRQTSQEIMWKKQKFHISCSIGISQFPLDSTKKDELLEFADSAMYHAKKSGKNKYSFYTEN